MEKKQKKSDEWEHIGDQVKTRKLIKSARFNWKYVDLAARLKAAGFSDKDLAFAYGVEPSTIDKWKQRYPQFRKACNEGTEIAVSHLVAKGLKSAGGYDYDEVKQEFEIAKDGTKKLVKEVKQTRHKDANANLLMFFLMNLAPQYFKDIRKVEIETKHNINIDVKESESIRKLVGALAQVTSVSSGQTIEADFEPEDENGKEEESDNFEIS